MDTLHSGWPGGSYQTSPNVLLRKEVFYQVFPSLIPTKTCRLLIFRILLLSLEPKTRSLHFSQDEQPVSYRYNRMTPRINPLCSGYFSALQIVDTASRGILSQ